ncbi:MAG: hypothetical protein Q4A78_12185 [Peptostreptococcaceae bacterium]|nr:hypothetical protein [Peptostreptococcaceae bacterium]
MQYIKRQVHHGWIVVNTYTGAHAHFRSEYGCRCIIRFLKENIVPDNAYLRESYKRLYGGRRKQMYINIQKGPKKNNR